MAAYHAGSWDNAHKLLRPGKLVWGTLVGHLNSYMAFWSIPDVSAKLGSVLAGTTTVSYVHSVPDTKEAQIDLTALHFRWGPLACASKRNGFPVSALCYVDSIWREKVGDGYVDRFKGTAVDPRSLPGHSVGIGNVDQGQNSYTVLGEQPQMAMGMPDPYRNLDTAMTALKADVESLVSYWYGRPVVIDINHYLHWFAGLTFAGGSIGQWGRDTGPWAYQCLRALSEGSLDLGSFIDNAEVRARVKMQTNTVTRSESVATTNLYKLELANPHIAAEFMRSCGCLDWMVEKANAYSQHLRYGAFQELDENGAIVDTRGLYAAGSNPNNMSRLNSELNKLCLFSNAAADVRWKMTIPVADCDTMFPQSAEVALAREASRLSERPLAQQTQTTACTEHGTHPTQTAYARWQSQARQQKDFLMPPALGNIMFPPHDDAPTVTAALSLMDPVHLDSMYLQGSAAQPPPEHSTQAAAEMITSLPAAAELALAQSAGKTTADTMSLPAAVALVVQEIIRTASDKKRKVAAIAAVHQVAQLTARRLTDGFIEDLVKFCDHSNQEATVMVTQSLKRKIEAGNAGPQLISRCRTYLPNAPCSDEHKDKITAATLLEDVNEHLREAGRATIANKLFDSLDDHAKMTVAAATDPPRLRVRTPQRLSSDPVASLKVGGGTRERGRGQE